MPVGSPEDQRIMAFEKDADGRMKERPSIAARFGELEV
jgi:hypothetical protein